MEGLTPEQTDAVDLDILRKELGLGYPEPEEKINILNFLKDIVSRKENVKTANLTNAELGDARLPVRTNIELASYCKFMGMDAFADVFTEDAQTLLGSSLSRGGFLALLAVTQKKESKSSIDRLGASEKQKKNWFGKSINDNK